MSDFPYDDEETVESVVDALKQWVATHPEPQRPFLIQMREETRRHEGPESSRALTPRQFAHEVEDRTEFGLHFIRFVFKQADRYGVRPQDFVNRAVEANRRPGLDPERSDAG